MRSFKARVKDKLSSKKLRGGDQIIDEDTKAASSAGAQVELTTTTTTVTSTITGSSISIKSPESSRGLVQLFPIETLNEASFPSSTESSNIEHTVDIVAIHGLNGDPYRTWTHDNGSLWLKDFLPKAIPGARVLSYGYPSQLFFNKSKARIEDFALDLLVSLSDFREESGYDLKPIIFVCHSLGGIVCKRALILAHEDDRYSTILNATSAVAFLGTPHQGSGDIVKLGNTFGNILNVCSSISGSRGFMGETKTDLLKDLRMNSLLLQGISASFSNRCRNLKILSCYETVTMPPFGECVVDKWSAIMNIPGEERIPLYANHVNICRFGDDSDKSYLKLQHALKRLVTEACKKREEIAPSIISLDDTEKSCMALLNSSSLGDFKLALPRRVKGTCEWILTNSQYVSWRSDKKAALLWITGHSGCGKTILSSYVTEYPIANTITASSHVLVCGFFCDQKIKGQNDGLGVLRSIVYQILLARRELLKYAKRAYASQGPNLIASLDSLWNIFTSVVTEMDWTEPLHVVIDAIDECEEITRNYILDRIADFIQKQAERIAGHPAFHCVKFLITSRPQPFILRLEGLPSSNLRIEETQSELSNDVKLLIKQRVGEIVKRNHCKPDTYKLLEESLWSKADRTFLWVTIVLHQLEKSVLARGQDFRRIIDVLPREMEAIYEHFLRTIPDEHQQLASKLLHILVGSQRTLALDEINIIFSIESHHSTLQELMDEGCQPDIQVTIERILGPLIRISESKVYLVHQSAKEFLCALSSREESDLSSKYGVDIQAAHDVLARSCIYYLNLIQESKFTDDSGSVELLSPISSSSTESAFGLHDAFNDPYSLGEDLLFQDKSDLLAENCNQNEIHFKLLDYTARFWTTHFRCCEMTTSQELLDRAMNIQDENSDSFKIWFQYFWTREMVDVAYPSCTKAMIIASLFGLSDILHIIVRDTHLPMESISTYAFYWSSRAGHCSVVKTLLGLGFPPDRQALEGKLPLHIAASFGRTDIIKVLLADSRINLNSPCKNGRTALSYAAGNGHTEVAETLMNSPGIDVNFSDRHSWSPLLWAAAGNSPAVSSILLQNKNVDQNHHDNTGRTAFSYAAGLGLYDVVKVFLRHSQVDVNLKDKTGRAAISWAAGNGEIQTTRLLAQHYRRVDLLSKDNESRNAISWACGLGRLEVVKVLIKYAPAGADEEDTNGWAPLAWAMNDGWISMVEVLLSTGSININRRDKSGRTALSWAAGHGHIEIIEALLAVEGVVIDEPDNDGRTPRGWASVRGSKDAIKAFEFLDSQ